MFESSQTLVCRGRAGDSEQDAILKILNNAYPSPEAVARFRLEFEIIQRLGNRSRESSGDARVIEAYALGAYHGRQAMLLEDIGGESLNRLMPRNLFTLTENLEIIRKIIDILEKIHGLGVVHKDINPSNIVFNPQTGQCRVIDFGIAMLLSRERVTIRSPSVMEGTLAYISPEQTGRMNRTVDYRSDFYALGATIYEMLTHRLAFPSGDPMESIHSHIARQPVPPHVVEPTVPPQLSEITLRLLAKNAEDRYQSVWGIRADVDECLRQLQTDDRITSFPLGQSDVSDQFQISQKLYGREEEMARLVNAFERVSKGNGELVLVEGYTGIGKSALIQGLHKPVTERRGYFAAGKFDQFQRDVPYSALLEACQNLIRQLLAESDNEIEAWRDRLLEALGNNGQVICDVIPEVEFIIGPQPVVSRLLSAEEARNRFQLVFLDFIRVFAQSEHPLVIFLDDLQWADDAAVQLMHTLLSSHPIDYLCLVGAYRVNEVDETHSVLIARNSLQAEGISVTTISLQPLKLADVTALIADSLYCEYPTAKPLAELVLAKTGGNPYFVDAFLRSLNTEGLLVFAREEGRWHWDLDKIHTESITENVADLTAKRVTELDHSAREILEVAACIGNRFDLETVASVSGHSHLQVANALWQALVKELIIPLAGSHELMNLNIPELVENVSIECKFSHDQVRHAVYDSITPTSRSEIHLSIGRFLVKITQDKVPGHRIFDIVNHLNLARSLVDETTEQVEIATLNLAAARRAKASAAFGPALNYLETGLRMLVASITHHEPGEMRLHAETEDALWTNHYSLALSLCLELAETAYLTGDFAQSNEWVATVRRQSRTHVDAAPAYDTHIRAKIAQNDLPEAVRTGLVILSLLGVKFPGNPTVAHILMGYTKTKLLLAAKRPKDLSLLPTMQNPRLLAAMRILRAISSVAYLATPKLFPLVVFKLVNLSVRHGNSPESGFAYAMFGIIVSGVMGDIESGHRLGELALRVQHRVDARELEAKVLFTVNQFLRPWKETWVNLLDPIMHGYQVGLETGDFEFAGHLSGIHIIYSFFMGKDLNQLEEDVARSVRSAARSKQDKAVHGQSLYRQAILNLRDTTDDPYQLVGPAYDEQQMLPIHLEVNDTNVIAHYYCLKLLLAYLFGRFAEAAADAAKMEEYLEGVLGTINGAIFNFYDSLIRLATFAAANEADKKRTIRRVKSNQKKMKKWARSGPANFLHKYYLVEAEHARVLGRNHLARDYYDRAIDLAQEYNYVNELALAYELAGRFYLARHKTHLAHHYLRDAHYTYARWGAEAKVSELENRYPPLAKTAESTPVGPSTGTTTMDGDTTLDIGSVLKATQTISGEIVLDVLLAKLMQLVIENAGADKGYLLLPDWGQADSGTPTWIIEAEGRVDQQSTSTQRNKMAIEDGELSVPIVNFVARTQETIVLQDASREGPFTQDEYIEATGPQSLLCMPLLNQGNLRGILYLENNLATHAFTPARLEVLNLLAAQAAVSIENAKLFMASQESELRYRTLFEESIDAIFILTPVGHLADGNRALFAMFGYPREAMLERHVSEFYADKADSGRLTAQLKESDTVRDFEAQFCRRDGVTMDCTLTISARRDEQGALLSYQGIIRDITSRKQAERVLADYSRTLEMEVEKRTQELSHALDELHSTQDQLVETEKMAALGNLVAGIAHEINTPVGIGVTAASTLERQTSELRQRYESGSMKRSDLERFLERSSRSSATLLSNLDRAAELISSFKQVAVDQSSEERRIFAIRPYAEEVIVSLQPRLRPTKHALHVEGPDDLVIDSFPGAFAQIITNLVVNSLEHAYADDENGHIWLRFHADGDWLVFEYADDGRGIAPEHIEHIFEPFFTTNRGGGGSGLGLHIVYNLVVQKLAGTIQCDSIPGEETRFTIRIPMASKDDP